ncbi:MAG: hypothetical protein R3304_00710 [Longimicrobiales bacterium]|nr:hypothetical protein [Longimicrobiales bacterium]
MVDDATAEKADRILQEALDRSGARDPRPFYRDRLRTLKESDPEGYSTAVAHYTDTLIPSVASGERDPLDAWTEYGRALAEAVASGRTVCIDRSGRSRTYEGPARDHLILHLPDDRGTRALLVGLPPTLTPAQRATYDVLVAGKQRLRD